MTKPTPKTMFAATFEPLRVCFVAGTVLALGVGFVVPRRGWSSFFLGGRVAWSRRALRWYGDSRGRGAP